MTDAEILANAPCKTWVTICDYDYGDCLHPLYLNCENQFYDEDEKRWVDMCLVDNYFHSFRSRTDIERIVEQDKLINELKERISNASDVAAKYAYIDGAHHKNWVINEMIKAIQTSDELVGNGWKDRDWLEECIAP